MVDLVEMIAYGRRVNGIQIRHCRWAEYDKTTRKWTYTNKEGNSLTLTRDEHDALSKPGYIVIQVRGETFGEAIA